MNGLASLSLKKPFTWKFGSGNKKKKHEVDSEECERVKSPNVFKFGAGSDSEDAFLGSITNILDGVVFSGSENRPPSPDIRRIHRLSSFRGEEDLNSAALAPVDEKTLLPVKERHAAVRQLSHRSGSPALPPIPPIRSDVERKNTETSFNPDNFAEITAIDNPLYQTIFECYSHVKKSPSLSENQNTHSSQEISETTSGCPEHYQTVTSDLPVLETVYARVDGDESEDDLDENNREIHLNRLKQEPIYEDSPEHTDNLDSCCGQTDENQYQEVEGDPFYQNLDEIIDSSPVDTLPELVIDVSDQKDSDFPSKSSPHGSASSFTSSGQSSLPPSPKLSVHIDKNRQSLNRSPDSGIFALSGTEQPENLPLNERSATLDEALIQFEILEREVQILAPKLKLPSNGNSKKLLKRLINSKTTPKGIKEAIVKQKASKLKNQNLLLGTGSTNMEVKTAEEAILEDLAENIKECNIPELPKSPQPTKLPSEDIMFPMEGVFQAAMVEVEPIDPLQALNFREDNTNKEEDHLQFSILDDSITSPSKRQLNIGALIAEEMLNEQKKKDSKRNEILEVENIGETYEDLEYERRRIIEKQTVKAKRINNWLRSPESFEAPLNDISSSDTLEEFTHPPSIPMSPPPIKPAPPPKSFSVVPADGVKPYKIVKTVSVEETILAEGEVVIDSILEQKEKTKQYWEAKMMNNAAVHPDSPLAKPRSNFPLSRAISPPLGFDNDNTAELKYTGPESVILGSHSPDDVLLDLPADGFVAVGSIITDADIEHNQPKKQYVFGVSEDNDSPLILMAKPKPNPKIVEVVTKRAETHREAIFTKPIPIDEEGALSYSCNSKETLIEREIRLQKEREEDLVKERQEALKLLQLGNNFNEKEPKKILEQSAEVLEITEVIREENSIISSSAEARIAQEIRDLRRREEEVKLMRERLYCSTNSNDTQGHTGLPSSEDNENFASIPTTDEGHYSDAEATNEELGSDGHNSRVESPETPVTYGNSHFPHQRTQSMDSMSSGHSSGDHSTPGLTHLHEHNGLGPLPKRRVMVKPFEEPDVEEIAPAYHLGALKETPIEREIRLARDREEELRKDKGRASLVNQITKPDKEVIKVGNRTKVTDKRDVQHRLATSRIQQEIEEASQREIELRSTGQIQTTSEERVDAKVARLSQLAEFSAEYESAREKRQRSASASQLNTNTPRPQSPPVALSKAAPVQISAHTETALTVPVKAAPLIRGISAHNLQQSTPFSPVRKFSTPTCSQKGVMAKFIASRGRINAPPAFVSKTYTPFASKPDLVAKPTKTTPPIVSPVASEPFRLEAKPEVTEERVEKREDAPPRRAFATAENKIQVELKEMKQREDELRLARMKTFAKSQPNLLAMMDDESEVAENKLNNGMSGLRSALSISNLADTEQLNGGDPKEQTLREAKGARRKSALIAQWEFRIQQNEN